MAGAFMDLVGTGTAHAGKKSFIRKYTIWFEVFGWVLIGCGTFYILFLVRDGAWRMYDPFAQISGMLLYVSCFYKPFRFFGRILLIMIVKPIWFIIHVIISIIRQLIRIAVRIVVLLLTPFVKLFRILSRNLFIKREI
ncbi:hypothetical protein H4683_003281 [Filibacter limicola]|uniref:Spore cortex biosynthesis protein YabQ n=2 Tax=Sporosarcina limicola TaxID=34101 RepID=A0A927MK30_9BACL|nr:spore cortex biosynthesis protein YabQ [Sporosarcina limicola]MBE1556160.1 hypothetical protein [Sporosarcina limicola]